MRATRQAKEVVPTATTAGVSVDVISLLEKKASALADRVAALEEENSALFRQNHSLVTENQSLKQRLQQTNPEACQLDQVSEDILKFLFSSPRAFTATQICHKFQLSMKVGWGHIDLLCAKDFILAGSFEAGIGYRVTGRGRAYCQQMGFKF